MKEISVHELNLISGGSLTDAANAAQVGAAVGGAMGVVYAASQGATASAVIGMGTIGAFAGAGYGVAGFAGFAVGTWLNNNTPIQSWLASGIDALAGTNYHNVTGVHYH